MTSPDSALHRDYRRMRLAARLMQHDARRSTLMDWTQLSGPMLRRVRLLSMPGVAIADEGPRGPKPCDTDWFLRRVSLQTEAGSAAALCAAYGVLPQERGRQVLKRLPSLDRGERLCHAFETYQSLVPMPRLTLERFLLLIEGLTVGDVIALGSCSRCRRPIVVPPARPTLVCSVCREEPSGETGERTGANDPGDEPSLPLHEPIQPSLF